MSKATRFQHDGRVDMDMRHLSPAYYVRRIRRRMHVCIGATSLLALAVLVGWILVTPSPNRIRFQITSILAVCVIPVIVICGMSLKWRFVRARAKRAGWLLCPVCLYDLSSSDTDSVDGASMRVCSECGARFDLDELKAAWLVRET